MSTFSERLRDERKRLGLNQTELAGLAGVQKQAQVHYEAGDRSPNAAYLQAIAAAGADVLYILTGTHAATHTALGQVRMASVAASKFSGSNAEQAQAAEVLFNQLNQPPLTRRQRALLENYERSNDAGKKIIEGTASMAAGLIAPAKGASGNMAKKAQPPPGSRIQTINAPVHGAVAAGNVTITRSYNKKK